MQNRHTIILTINSHMLVYGDLASPHDTRPLTYFLSAPDPLAPLAFVSTS